MASCTDRRAVLGSLAGLAALGLPARAADTLGVSRMLPVGTGGGLTIGFQTYPTSLALADGEVVLTFDDGPISGPTDRVLSMLAAEQTRATFFCIGRNAAAHPALCRRIVAEGHTLAHHSYSHPWTFRRMSEAAGRADILKGFQAVDEAGFGAFSGAPRVPFFRYPGFADTPALNGWLAQTGVGVFGCDLWASDWTPMGPERELALVTRRLEHARRGIILFHDVQPQTVAMLPAFLRWLREKSYRIVHMTPGSAPPALTQAGPGWRSQTEAIIAGRAR